MSIHHEDPINVPEFTDRIAKLPSGHTAGWFERYVNEHGVAVKRRVRIDAEEVDSTALHGRYAA